MSTDRPGFGTADGRVVRLDAFAAALDRLRVEDLLALAARPLDPAASATAQVEADEAARFAGRGATLRAAHERVDRYVLGMFNASTLQPGWMEANWGRPGSAADRANLARSLRDAVTALALEDVLSDEACAVLLGPWAALLDGDAAGEADEGPVSR
jgi:hypothetical protein